MAGSKGGASRGRGSAAVRGRGAGGRGGRGVGLVASGRGNSSGGGRGKGNGAGRGKLPASPSDGNLQPSIGGRKVLSTGGASASGTAQEATPRRPEIPNTDGTPPGRNRSTGAASSHSSNPSGDKRPASNGTPSSGATISISRTSIVPLQYPASSNRNGSHQLPTLQLPNLNRNLHLRDEVDEEQEQEQEEEEAEDEDLLPEDVEGENDAVEGEEPEEEDYDELLNNILALPGRDNLPLLSEVPIPGKKTYWYGPFPIIYCCKYGNLLVLVVVFSSRSLAAV